MPQPTEWQRIGNQIDAAFITSGPDFVDLHTLIDPLQCPSKEGLRSHERNCPQHCQTSKRKGFIKMRKSHILAKSTPTLTQSGLLAVLLQRQRDKVIELAERRAHRSQSRSTFSSVLTWLLACARAAASARPFHRGVGGTLPRHP
jgi:hypothetical protein